MCEERYGTEQEDCVGNVYQDMLYYSLLLRQRCIKCPEGITNIWKYILVAYGPLTVFYI